jgi:hypothetical protein
LEEEKASLKDYVLKYEAELSKHEAQVAQLTADLQQARPPNITTSHFVQLALVLTADRHVAVDVDARAGVDVLCDRWKTTATFWNE